MSAFTIFTDKWGMITSDCARWLAIITHQQLCLNSLAGHHLLLRLTSSYVLILVAPAVRNVHIGLIGRQKHVLSTCTCVCDSMAGPHLADGGLREGLKVDVRGLVVIMCWKMYYVHKNPHKAESKSVCFCTCYIEKTIIYIFSGNIKATAFWKARLVLQRAF